MKKIKILLFCIVLTTVHISSAINSSRVLKKTAGTALGLYSASCFSSFVITIFLDQTIQASEQAGDTCIDSCGEPKAQKLFGLSRLFIIPGTLPGYIAADFVKQENEELTMLGVNGLLGLCAAYASYKFFKSAAQQEKEITQELVK